MDDVPRGLVGTAWVAQRTGYHRTTVAQAAASGRIPGATKPPGVNTWRFDPDEIERWLAAGRPRQSTGTPIPSPAAEHHQRIAPAAKSAPLTVLFPGAAHRGIHDRPAAGPASIRRKRRARS